MKELETYIAYLRSIPAKQRRYGKVHKYEPYTLKRKWENVNRFLKRYGITDMSGVTEERVAEYIEGLFTEGMTDYNKYMCAREIEMFLEWCQGQGLWEGKIKYQIPSAVETNWRKIPAMKSEQWQKLRNGGRTSEESAIMNLFFNQFRRYEIENMKWENFPEGFFNDYRGATLVDVLRKGGELWKAKLDPQGWDELKRFWYDCGCPESGYLFKGKKVLTTFRKVKNRTFYRPEDKQIRKQLTPHCVRHYQAQVFAINNPNLAGILGAVIGGWKPGSNVYLNRYVNVRDSFPHIFDNADIKF